MKLGDIGTKERLAKGDVDIDIIDSQKVARVRKRPIYDMLYKRKTITYEQRLAAEKICDIYYKSQPLHNCEYRENTQGGKREPQTIRMLEYADKFNKLLKLLDTTEKTLLIHVIINDNTLNKDGMQYAQKRARRELLRITLNKLAKCFGYRS